MSCMEVEFTYAVTVTDTQHEQLDAAATRAVELNPYITWYQLSEIRDGRATLAIRSGGHDRSQITRRFVAPVRALFTRAKIPVRHVQLISSLLVPTARSLTLAEGRTPQGTFTDPALRQMLADHGRTLSDEEEPVTA